MAKVKVCEGKQLCFNGRYHDAGTVHEVPDKVVASLVESGVVEAVVEKPAAVVRPVEKPRTNA